MKYAPSFTAICPCCHREINQGTFRVHALRQFLEDGTLRFYCRNCNAEWEPNEGELANVERLLTTRPLAHTWNASTPPAS